jgi:hypothetical protein
MLQSGERQTILDLWRTRVAPFFGCFGHKTGAYDMIQVAGMKVRLLPCEAYGAFRTMQKIHGEAGGAWVWGPMGCSRTTQTIAVHHMQHRINEMWKQIEDHPDDHCPNNQDVDGKCLKDDAMVKVWGFNCPCWKGSPTHFVEISTMTAYILRPINADRQLAVQFSEMRSNDKGWS